MCVHARSFKFIGAGSYMKTFAWVNYALIKRCERRKRSHAYEKRDRKC